MKLADPAEVVESWRRVEAEGRAAVSSDPATWPEARRLGLSRGRQAETGALEAQIAALKQQVSDAQQQVADMRGSTSWRLTAPLRTVMQRLRKGGN